MFRISCMVDDKRLPDTLRALAALGAYDVEPVPVVNAKPKGTTVAQENDGNLADRFHANLVKNGLKGFTTAGLKQWLTGHGLNASSATYIIQQLVKLKLVKSTSRGNYEVKK